MSAVVFITAGVSFLGRLLRSRVGLNALPERPVDRLEYGAHVNGHGTRVPSGRSDALYRLADTRFRRRDRRARVRSRVRPLLGRSPARFQGAAVLDRVRPAAAHLARPWAGLHGILAVGDPARRLREDARRARGAGRGGRAGSRFQPAADLAAHRRAARGPGVQLPVRDRRLLGRCSRWACRAPKR